MTSQKYLPMTEPLTSLLQKPQLLILDEPTNGMDPSGMREVRNLLVYLAEEGVTIFISSHMLYEIEQICDRVAVINKGRLVAEGRVRDLVGQKTAVRVRVPSARIASKLLYGLTGCSNIRPNGEYVTVSGVSSQAVVSHLTSNGIIPSEVTTDNLDLESIFLELTNQELVEV